uniref:Rho guanine nucleotide exchange factor (GEF) 40 n=1 Tax=Poecilia latipinna TaxID=48699 RepID=A0A3B3W051_9TELE
GSEAMEDCVQGALSSLYPPFESTAPPLLSQLQVFSVLESTYQHDSLRYLLDYFVPAKHLLHKLQQHACSQSQYLGCLFLHSGWPLCLGEKVVVQLSTLDWRLLRSNDFYLQVVPFSTRCPRLALKCLAPGGRTVQEILVPESQHPLVFTSEWLHSINKERGHKREVGGGLDTCLVSTCDGVVRVPWKEIVYPKFLHDPSEELGLGSNRLSSEGGSSLGGWGGSSSGDMDSWSWDDEDDDSLPPNCMGSDPAIRRRRSEDGLGRTARQPQMDGDYVELLEPRGGPDGGVDTKQRYLEMHGICKTRTLPLCRRGKAIKLRKGKAWGYAKPERSGSFRGAYSTKEKEANPKDVLLPPKPPTTVSGSARVRPSYSSSAHDSDEGDKTSRDNNSLESHSHYFDVPLKERRPGVGKERDSNGFPQPSRDGHQNKDSQRSDSLIANEIYDLSHKSGHDVEGQSDHGSHSDSVFEDADKPLSGDALLRELDTELLQSGKLQLTTVDRLGRALVFTDAGASEEGFCSEEVARVLSCYHRITRPEAKEKGLTVLIDSRCSQPSSLCLSALKRFQHIVRGTGVLQQYVDSQQLPKQLDGDFSHTHSDWLTFRLRLEKLTERCESALSLLGEALQSMEMEEMPNDIKAVPESIDKHRQLMASVLADQRLTELQQRGGAWLAGLTNCSSGLAQRSPDCAALNATSQLYDGVDDALHRLVQVSNRRGRDLEALGRLAGMVDKLEKCDKEIEQVQSQLEEYKDPPLSLSRLSLKQQKFRTFRETANELHSDTLSVLSDLEGWCELNWAGLSDIQIRLPPVREKLRDMSHCLSDCWTTLDNTQRLLSTLTEWCDAVSSTPSSPTASSSTCPLASLPPIPPSRFQDARSLAMELGGGALLDLWTQTVERYQRTVAQVKPRFLHSERTQSHGQGKAKTPSGSTFWDLVGPDGEGDWGLGGGDGGLQSWGSLASLFRPQTCSTLKIGEDKGNRRDGSAGNGGGAGGAGGGKFLQNLLNPGKKSPPDAPLPPKPPRKRHPSFDLQALLAPRKGTATPKPESPVGGASRSSPMSWLGRKNMADPVIATSMAAAIPGWGVGVAGGGGGGVLIRGVEVSSKEVVDHTGSPRQHVLLGRTERDMGADRTGSTAQKLYLLWCRMLSSERQYVAVLKGVEETYLPLLELSDTPASIRGKGDTLFPNWGSLTAFHSRDLLPAMEGALVQSLLQQDCFSKYREEFLQYSHYIRSKPEMDSPLVTQAADFFKSPLSPLSFPYCLQAPIQRLEQYCEALEELGGLNLASDSALSVLRHAQRHGEDLRASDLIVGCPISVAERGDLVRQGELTVCGGPRRKRAGVRNVFLYQHTIIFTKQKSPSPGRTVYNYKHSIKQMSEMGLTQNVGDEGVKFEVWVRQAPRTRDCITLQAQNRAGRESWAHDIAHLLWTHAINNTLCLKESLCMGVSSKLLLDATGTPGSELDSICSLSDRHSSCSDSSSVGSQKEGGSPASGRDPRSSSGSTSYSQ